MRLAVPPGMVLSALLLWAGPVAGSDAARGEYVFRAAGCYACHTDEDGGGAALAGGPALRTPLGTFYAPNITPDPVHGIGRWSEQDFERALTQGIAPGGSPYYPAFPYTAYTRMRSEDLRALWAYLRAVPAAAQPSRPHELPWPLGYRWVVWGWRWLYFEPGPLRGDPARGPAWNRGAYLVEAMAHCAECHTPRDWLGGLRDRMRYAGATEGPEGGAVPNITPDRETGIGRWRADDLAYYLATGATPSGDYAGGAMAEVIDHGTRHLDEADRLAIASYILALPPVHNAVSRSARKASAPRGEFE